MSVDTDVSQYTETQHIWRPRSSWLSILFSKTPFFPLVPLQLVASLLNLYVFLKTFSSLSKAYQSSLNFSISFTLPSTANVSTLTTSASITSSYYLLFPFSTPQITHLKCFITVTLFKTLQRLSAASGLKSKLLKCSWFGSCFISTRNLTHAGALAPFTPVKLFVVPWAYNFIPLNLLCPSCSAWHILSPFYLDNPWTSSSGSYFDSQS